MPKVIAGGQASPVVKVVDGIKWKVKIRSQKKVKLKSFIPQLLFYKNINIVFFFHAQQQYNINLF
jgi:hypothetical protein